MKSWKTTIGGALGELGTALAGVGTVTSLVQLGNGGGPSSFTLYCTAAGFILGCIGRFFTSLFAADSGAVQKALAAHTDQIAELKGDTGFVTKGDSLPGFTRAPHIEP